MKKIFMAVIPLAFMLSTAYQSYFTDIPKTWDIKAIKDFHLPPPDTSVQVTYAPEEYYNSLPEHVIYKTYPLYVREFEKSGYLDSLRKLEPEIVFDPNKLKTQEDWIKAGEVVFNWPAAFTPYNDKAPQLDSSLFRNGNGKFTREGIYPFSRYVITEKGKLLVGSLSCASCHTRVMPSGEAVPGAQGNVFNTVRFGNAIHSGKIPFPVFQFGQRQLNYTPWAPAGMRIVPESPQEYIQNLQKVTAGISDRQGMGYGYPFATPSLIGIKDIKYLDATGLMRHEGPGDLMRYAAFNQGMDMLTSYNGFMPGGKNNFTELPPANEWNHPFGYAGKRYSDAQLYALTQYIYSLQPPENPNKFSEATLTRGKKVFTQAGCITCHTPPLYTNNKLTPVNGFEPPEEHLKKYDIFNVSVETDSVSALYTRRGTGYYKVPSLRGVWFRSAFFHNGNLTSLEEILDPKRLQPDYVPTGFKPPHLKTMPVKGHIFGMELSEPDKKALISFLKTL
jgi:hypothetical protein